MEAYVVSIVDGNTMEQAPVKLFSNRDIAIEWIIQREAPYIEDPDEIGDIVDELQESGMVCDFNHSISSSYQITPVVMDEW